MTRLKAMGLGFSLDDFGMGCSSLFYLKRLALDQLKIDQSFVREILIDADNQVIHLEYVRARRAARFLRIYERSQDARGQAIADFDGHGRVLNPVR